MSTGQIRHVKVSYPVFIGSALGIGAIALWAIIAPVQAGSVLGTAVAWICRWFGSFYVCLASAIIVFVLYLGFSRYGRVRLGPPSSRPEFSLFSWAAMLFAAGIGTDIMFFSVAGPINHYMNPPSGKGQSLQAAAEAPVWTIFHYGITGWGMYALMGIALGYFAYRRKMPLSVRSSLFPVLGKRIDGPLGHLVDSAAILGTIFGVATTLGIGVVQLNVGLDILFGTGRGLPVQIILVVLAVIMATASATTGVNKGIRILSQLNVFLAVFLIGWALFTGRTSFLLNAMASNIGDFVQTFPSRSMQTFPYEDKGLWMGAWTLFFWAWWVAWASFIGMFLARISRGRSLREFVIGTMLIPFSYVVLWISVFGNAAIDLVRSGNLDFARNTIAVPESGFYALLQTYPAPFFTIGLATFVGLLFYVTSADSGALVMANLCSNLPTARSDAKASLRIFWAVLVGVLTVAMLVVGGIHALQNATIIMGLPFAFVMILVMIGLAKALREERSKVVMLEHSARNVVAGSGTDGASWHDRLARTFDQVSPAQASKYITRVAQPALETIARELQRQGISSEVVRADTDSVEEVEDRRIYDRLKLTAFTGPDQFIYRILAVDTPAAVYAGVPLSSARSTRLEVHLPNGDGDYNVMGYSKSALIHDVLDHFDRYQEYWRMQERSNTPVVPFR